MSIADKLTTIAENEQKVYDAGKQAEYDEFWDVVQNKGNAINYEYAFCGVSWKIDNFKPKYDLKPVRMAWMFYQNKIQGSLKEILLQQGKTLDTSASTSMKEAFYHSNFTELPTIDFTATTSSQSIQNCFAGCQKLVTIEKIIMPTNSAVQYGGLFANAYALKNLTIEGEIMQTLSLTSCTITVESAKSVINALKNFIGTDKELTYKLTLKGTVWTALNEAEAPPNCDTWQEYVYSLGWNYA